MQKATLKFYFILLLLSFSIHVVAQKKYDLKTIGEYQKFDTVYQNWLQNTGLSDILNVNKIDIYDNQLALYLEISGKNEQEKLNQWFSLRKHYEENKAFPIHEQLYKNMISIYKISPDKANIQIWEGEYYFMIYYNESSKQIMFEESKLRSQIEYTTVNISNSDILIYSIQEKNPNIQKTKKLLYQRILDFSKSYYKSKVPSISRDFSQESISATRPLIFTVNNMRNEVLYDADNSFLCDMINWFYDEEDEVDCRPREFLEIEITAEIIKTTENNQDKYIAEIKCEITGKYAPTTGGDNPDYYNDMEADYSYYLEKYTKKFTQQIENHLNNK